MNFQEIEEDIKKVSSSYVLDSKKDDSKHSWFFSLQGKRVWNVVLDFSYFPQRLPQVKLLDQDAIGTLAHVNRKCIVCVEESDTVLIDTTSIVYFIEEFLKDIIDTLDYSSLKIAIDELLDEYEGYFEVDKKGDVNSFYNVIDELEFLHLQIVSQKSGQISQTNYPYHYPVLLSSRYANILPKNFSNVSSVNSTIINIINLPLEVAVLPPLHGERITAKYIQSILSNISIKNKKTLDKLLKKTKIKKEFFILMSMPRIDTERTQLLLHYTSKKDLTHPLSKYSDEWKVEHYHIQRHNKEYLLERGGSQNSLLNKEVVIVGCGSVGGEIAYMLAKSGVGKLTLIDPEFLLADNIYRHRLGGNYLNYKVDERGKVKPYSKVRSLKHAIENDLPHIKIDAVQTVFEKVINEEYIKGANLIIFAIGSPSSSLKFNAEVRKRDIKNAIFCWNEAAGYGGHSVFFNYDESCLECLYSNEKGFSVNCKLNFLEIGQNISKNLTGCAGVFTPFSYVDSSQTALLATNQAVEFLLGKNYNSRAISWKGKGSDILKATKRYYENNLMEEIVITKEESCKVCNE